MIETIMKTTQKYAFLCCALFALNAQSIHAEDQSIHAEDSINHDFDDSNDRNFQECKESQREEREDQEDRPDTSRGFDLSRKLTEEQEAELNKVMNSSVNLCNKSLERIRIHSELTSGVSLIKDQDHIEYHLRKNITKSTDDAIDNTMIAERAFLLSTVSLAALSNPASVSALFAGSMIYSIYRLHDRINFRENYKKDPIKAKASIDNWSVWKKHLLASGLASSSFAIIHSIRSIIRNRAAIARSITTTYDWLSTSRVNAQPLFAVAQNIITGDAAHETCIQQTIPTATEMPTATGTPIAPWEQAINYSEIERAALIVKNSHQTPRYLIDIDRLARFRYHENGAPEATGTLEDAI